MCVMTKLAFCSSKNVRIIHYFENYQNTYLSLKHNLQQKYMHFIISKQYLHFGPKCFQINHVGRCICYVMKLTR